MCCLFGIAVILSLLDNGGVKTLNKCELMMVLMAAVRGLAMFKRLPEVREELMKPLAKRRYTILRVVFMC